MNLLISLPLGIIIIALSYLALNRFFRDSLYMVGGILALVVFFVYSLLALLNWPGADVYAIHLALYMVTVYGMTIILKQRQQKARLHWAPVAIFVFFGIIIVVDSVFILLAQNGMNQQWAQWILPEAKNKKGISSVFPGTVSHDFREKTEQFNEYQKMRLAQAELGWRVKPGWREKAVAGKPNQLLLELRDRDGQPLKNASIDVRFLYPGNSKLDAHTTMTYSDGLYRADLQLNHVGNWDMIVKIVHPDGEYELRNRTTLHAANE